jgi:hypothetical protein
MTPHAAAGGRVGREGRVGRPRPTGMVPVGPLHPREGIDLPVASRTSEITWSLPPHGSPHPPRKNRGSFLNAASVCLGEG